MNWRLGFLALVFGFLMIGSALAVFFRYPEGAKNQVSFEKDVASAQATASSWGQTWQVKSCRRVTDGPSGRSVDVGPLSYEVKGLVNDGTNSISYRELWQAKEFFEFGAEATFTTSNCDSFRIPSAGDLGVQGQYFAVKLSDGGLPIKYFYSIPKLWQVCGLVGTTPVAKIDDPSCPKPS